MTKGRNKQKTLMTKRKKKRTENTMAKRKKKQTNKIIIMVHIKPH